MRKLKWIWIIALLGLIVGSVGFFNRVFHGHLNANTGSNVSWGLWVSGYIYFIGLSAGAFLLSALIYVFDVKRLAHIGRLVLFTALVCLVMAMLSIWLDLGHPLRSLTRFLTSTSFASPMGVMIWLYSVYFILVVAELFYAVRSETMGLNSRRVLFSLGVVGIPLAIVFSGGVGCIFGVTIARPFWHSGLTPIIFIVEALLSGGALITVLAHFLDPERGSEKHRDMICFLGRILVGFLALYVLCYLSEFLVSLYSPTPDQRVAYRNLLTGPYAFTFWLGQVLPVIVIPALLLTIGRRSSARVSLAALLIVLGFIAVRFNIVAPAQTVPAMEGLQTAYIDHRLLYSYTPSLMEWLFELWVVSVGAILFLIGLRIIPILQKRTAQRGCHERI